MSSSRFALGFTDLNFETDLPALPLTGHLPTWLEGTLIRNGPSGFAAGDQPLIHWFDGWAMLHAFGFHDGCISYRNRWLVSNACKARLDGRLRAREFATGPLRPWWMRWNVLAHREFTDNASVNVVHAAGRYLALTESPEHVEFNPVTLATAGNFRFHDRRTGELVTAHPLYDGASRCWYWQTTALGLRSSYRLLRLPDGTDRREPVAKIPCWSPAYLHSFAMTEHRLVIAEFPLTVQPLRLALTDTSFLRSLRWKPQLGTRFIVVDKRTGRFTCAHLPEPLFAFHHINAADDEDAVVLDLCGFDSDAIVASLELSQLRDASVRRESPVWRRFRINLRRGRVERLALPPICIEMPRLMPGQDGRPGRYAWGVGAQPDNVEEFPNQLVKIDLQSPGVVSWHQDGCYPGEPVPVPRPGSASEDDGVALSVVLDTTRRRSFLLICNAANLRELARAELPHHIPFGFHGAFFPV